MHHVSSVYFHLFGRNEFSPWLYLPPRTCLLYYFPSCHFQLLCGALGWWVVNFSALGFWFNVFSYCLYFAPGFDIIDLHGLELWTEVLPCSIYQLLLLKQPGCPHLILSLLIVAFPVCFTLKFWVEQHCSSESRSCSYNFNYIYLPGIEINPHICSR